MLRRTTQFKNDYIRKGTYRPFVATNCYADHTFLSRAHQLDQMFPDRYSENRVICAPGTGSKKAFSALMVGKMPDLGFNDATRCFPRYQYLKPQETPDATGTFDGIDTAPDRIDNISDTALYTFREHYKDDTITKDAIFDYVYGILHAPALPRGIRKRLIQDDPPHPLCPRLPRLCRSRCIPRLPPPQLRDLRTLPFRSRIRARRRTAAQSHFRLTEKAMRFADKETQTTLILNEHIRLSGIPETAHRYVVNGRTPLAWFIDRYKITKDKDSGIVNDPNGWFADPRDLVAAIERIVYVSVESARIVEGLPVEITEGD